ncbi:hypothetical protein QBC46DRAFT_342452 [Diplogelasinospora grovesii]|uniref:Uncharacterized protein n=1 Tax=Diplogelasinospora grovesii TaxID=303347 RepID=A0AAN6N5C8_9PEZI|nr:hypothetical protein QBC46DRAFT_342452 [Diplogelasinospora grovesii]
MVDKESAVEPRYTPPPPPLSSSCPWAETPRWTLGPKECKKTAGFHFNDQIDRVSWFETINVGTIYSSFKYSDDGGFGADRPGNLANPLLPTSNPVSYPGESITDRRISGQPTDNNAELNVED